MVMSVWEMAPRVFLNPRHRNILRRCFRYVFGVQIPSQVVFGCLGKAAACGNKNLRPAKAAGDVPDWLQDLFVGDPEPKKTDGTHGQPAGGDIPEVVWQVPMASMI